MTTNQMRYCLTVATDKSFSRAAEHLFISQPTLTYQINALENEIGFKIFVRSSRGVDLTPAGRQFVESVTRINKELLRSIEAGKNLEERFSDTIVVSLMHNQRFFALPDAMRLFSKTFPTVQIIPDFREGNRLNSFLLKESDLLIYQKDMLSGITGVDVHDLYTSRLCLVVSKQDHLAGKKLITGNDLFGKTLLVSDRSPEKQKEYQNSIVSSGKVRTYYVHNLEASLVYIAAGYGVALIPDYLYVHDDRLAWIPVDCPVYFTLVACLHSLEKRTMVFEFLKALEKTSKEWRENPYRHT